MIKVSKKKKNLVLVQSLDAQMGLICKKVLVTWAEGKLIQLLRGIIPWEKKGLHNIWG